MRKLQLLKNTCYFVCMLIVNNSDNIDKKNDLFPVDNELINIQFFKTGISSMCFSF